MRNIDSFSDRECRHVHDRIMDPRKNHLGLHWYWLQIEAMYASFFFTLTT